MTGAAERYEQAACGLLTTAPDGLITGVNQTLLTWLGYQRDDVVGKLRLSDFLTRGGRIFLETHYRPQLRLQGLVRELALSLVTADGQRLPVLLNAVTDANDLGAEIQVAILDARERRSYEQELLNARREAVETAQQSAAMARTLQQTLIPDLPPEISGLTTAVVFEPATGEVGGDFYDVFPIGRNEWAVMLGDVSGKGVGAAVVGTLVRHTIRALLTTGDSPAQSLAGLHRVLERDTPEMFCTIAVLHLTRGDSGWTVRMASGGHPPAVRIDQSGQAELVRPAGPLVGAFPNPKFEETSFEITSGDLLVLYTDGITEARRGSDQFGEERLLTALEAGVRDPESTVHRLLAAAMEFQSGDLRDDIAVLALGVP